MSKGDNDVGTKTNPMILCCALSGLTPMIDPVVTPSGRICERRLLLAKLRENGNVDPFDEKKEGRSLDESQLISLSQSALKCPLIPPRLPSSMNNEKKGTPTLPWLLQSIQTEFDATLLELYETRKAFEEIRRELSQALYQNDAAIRVVARLAMERDAAREQLAALSSKPPPAMPAEEKGEHLSETNSNKRPRVESDNEVAIAPKPPPPPAPVAADEGPTNAIPPSDLDEMSQTWKILSKSRRASKKKLDGSLTSSWDDVSSFAHLNKKSWHKSNAKPGITAITSFATQHGHDHWIVTAGRDKYLVVYRSSADQNDAASGRIVATCPLSTKAEVTSVDLFIKSDDASSSIVAAGAIDGSLHVFLGSDFSSAASLSLNHHQKQDHVVGTSIQPTGKYVLVAMSSSARVLFCSVTSDQNAASLAVLATFSAPENSPNMVYTCGGLHPDGLIYGAGTKDGKLLIWDLKNQTLASTLETSSDKSKDDADDEDDSSKAVTSLSFSENGYHFASSHGSIHTQTVVRVWDLRKLKCLATLSPPQKATIPAAATMVDEQSSSLSTTSFDPSGKYLAYTMNASSNIVVVMVKDWNKTLVLSPPSENSSKNPLPRSMVGWGLSHHGLSLVSCSNSERPVRFWSKTISSDKNDDDAPMKQEEATADSKEKDTTNKEKKDDEDVPMKEEEEKSLATT